MNTPGPEIIVALAIGASLGWLCKTALICYRASLQDRQRRARAKGAPPLNP